jgi:O-6-methylguanine DNA methyltransferase
MTIEETPMIVKDADLAALAQHLAASAPPMMDPAFRLALRAELVGIPLTDEAYYFAPLETPVGDLLVLYQGTRVRLITGGDEVYLLDEAQREFDVIPSRTAALPPRIARRILAAIGGKRQLIADEELAQLTPFQRSVLAVTRRIPRGEVRSYAWIAREVGAPGAVRAVGTALAQNPLPLLIPCHRVIKSDGALGRYSGGGTLSKDRILHYEGVDLAGLQSLAREGLRFQGSRTTKIYCLPTCYSGKHMQDRNRVYFHSPTEAAQKGYRPCKLCRPTI